MTGWNEAAIQTFWVGLGGFLGANARYWLGVWVTDRMGPAFPWATFVINVSGSFLLGLFMAATAERLAAPASPALRLFFAVGLVGAYTTFSTFEWETYALVSAGGLARAFWNAFGSLLAGFVAVWIGIQLGRVLGRPG